MKSLFVNNLRYQPVIEWCLESMLKIPDYQLDVEFCTISNSGEFLPSKRRCKVRINRFLERESHIRTVLFHEMRHYWQWLKWNENPKKYYQFNFDKRPLSVDEYRWDQREIDAKEFSSDAAREYNKKFGYRA